MVRWEVATVHTADCNHLLEVADRAAARIDELAESADGRVLAVRVVVVGQTNAHGTLVTHQHQLENELYAHAIERGDIYLERVVVQTAGRVTVEALAQRRDALADLFRAVAEVRDDDDALEALRQEVTAPLSGLAAELLREEEVEFREVLDQARQLLEGRLLEGSEENA